MMMNNNSKCASIAASTLYPVVLDFNKPTTTATATAAAITCYRVDHHCQVMIGNQENLPPLFVTFLMTMMHHSNKNAAVRPWLLFRPYHDPWKRLLTQIPMATINNNKGRNNSNTNMLLLLWLLFMNLTDSSPSQKQPQQQQQQQQPQQLGPNPITASMSSGDAAALTKLYYMFLQLLVSESSSSLPFTLSWPHYHHRNQVLSRSSPKEKEEEEQQQQPSTTEVAAVTASRDFIVIASSGASTLSPPLMSIMNTTHVVVENVLRDPAVLEWKNQDSSWCQRSVLAAVVLNNTTTSSTICKALLTDDEDYWNISSSSSSERDDKEEVRYCDANEDDSRIMEFASSSWFCSSNHQRQWNVGEDQEEEDDEDNDDEGEDEDNDDDEEDVDEEEFAIASPPLFFLARKVYSSEERTELGQVDKDDNDDMETLSTMTGSDDEHCDDGDGMNEALVVHGVGGSIDDLVLFLVDYLECTNYIGPTTSAAATAAATAIPFITPSTCWHASTVEW